MCLYDRTGLAAEAADAGECIDSVYGAFRWFWWIRSDIKYRIASPRRRKDKRVGEVVLAADRAGVDKLDIVGPTGNDSLVEDVRQPYGAPIHEQRFAAQGGHLGSGRRIVIETAELADILGPGDPHGHTIPGCIGPREVTKDHAEGVVALYGASLD